MEVPVGIQKRMVLTDRDFGRAYLTEGWARRFVLELFLKYTVLFVGYSHNDPVMQYLARGLPPGDSNKKRYAFDLNESKGLGKISAFSCCRIRSETRATRTSSYRSHARSGLTVCAQLHLRTESKSGALLRNRPSPPAKRLT
jgi:hypothetical protein